MLRFLSHTSSPIISTYDSEGDYYRRLSEENRIREIVIEPMRGKILDRKGFILAENKKGMWKQKREDHVSPHVSCTRGDGTPSRLPAKRGCARLENDNCINKLIPGDKVGKKGIEKAYECELRELPERN